MQQFRRWLVTFAVAMVWACPAASGAPRPRNIILLIGDGMGFAQTSQARLSLEGPGGSLAMDTMRYAALVRTQSATRDHGVMSITDSAAAATAIATGHKTLNGMLAVRPDGTPVRTVLEAAADRGCATGLVTTVTITHATPAGFGAHIGARGDEPEIAPQYIARRIDVLLGGGEAVFAPRTVPGSRRKDDRDILAEARAAGYTVARTASEMAAAQGPRLLGLFAMGYMTTFPPEPSLADMASRAIDILSRNRRGFFAMIEGGQIDSACHANDAPRALRQTLEFDAAVRRALDFARRRRDTLVIVTADHETGGMTLVEPAAGSGAAFQVKWGTKGHTAMVVPLLADGPGAEIFSGVMDNTDIAKRIARLMGEALTPDAPAAR